MENNTSFDEALKEMEEKKEYETFLNGLEPDEVTSVVSLISILLQTEVFSEGNGVFCSWYTRKSELFLDTISRQVKLVDWDVDIKTQLAVEGLCARYNLEYDFYMSEKEKQKLDKRLGEMNKNNLCNNN